MPTLSSTLEPPSTANAGDSGEGSSRGAPAVSGMSVVDTLLPLTCTSSSSPTAEELMSVCKEFVKDLKEGTPWVTDALDRNYVAMPDDADRFSFWMAPLLPLDDHEKAKLLPIRSAKLRLRLVVYWIEQLKSQWWFNGGCVIS